MEREGLQLCECPSRVADFRDSAEVARVYPAEIQQFVLALTGADAVVVTGPCDARTVRPPDLVSADANFDRHGLIVRSFEALQLPQHVPHSAFSDARVAGDAVPRASVEMRTVAYWYD